MSCNCSLSYCNDFSKTLHYISPAHGGWGVIKIAALVPESSQLFVAPMACGRHGALGGIEAGIKHRVHYLYLEEADIVSGGYEQQIYDGVDELFEYIEKPKVLFVFVACIDDMLGTDNDTIIKNLNNKYPEVKFRTCHMNPVSMDTATPPGVFLERTMYGLLEKEDKTLVSENKPFILLTGNNDNIYKSCELYKYMSASGYEVRHISECKNYEEFRELAASRLNLVLRPVAKAACMGLQNKIGVPYQICFVSYNPEEVRASYETLANNLGLPVFDMEEDYENAVAAINHLKSVIGDREVAIDYQAVLKPFTLAKTLLQHGINVTIVACGELAAFEKADREWVLENYPDIHVVNAAHPELVKYELRGKDCICVGFDVGYMTMSEHTSSLMEDQGLFGFDGIVRLMKEIEEVALTKKDLWTEIREAKLII